MDSVAFWLHKYPNAEEILCTSEEICGINRLTCRRLSNLVFDLSQYPSYISASAISSMILENEFSEEAGYVNGEAVTSDYYAGLDKAMNRNALQGMVQVDYGFTLRRSNIRTFPTNDFYVKSPNDQEFDRFQETALDPAEPLICLHHSADGKWRFVQAGNYRGWVETTSIAVTKDRSLWLNYSQAADFLVVTGNRLTLGEDPHLPDFSGLVFAMGAKLPLLEAQSTPTIIANRTLVDCHAVLLPVRDNEDLLAFRPALVPKSADVHHGYLRFSRANLLRQAFKLQGDRYGWGGLFGSRDCSALVQDVFRSVGIFLARNAGEQAQGAGTQISLADTSPDERIAILHSLPPGSTLHFPGHVMLYLGEHQGQFYVIHAIAACGNPARPQPDGTLASLPLNGIMVTDLSLPRVNGKSLLDSLTEANCIP
jgi:cell wall-associated NlpC family hydrolase